MLKFSEIIESDDFNLESKLKHSAKYLAHFKEGKSEALTDHTALALDYFLRLITDNKIELILDKIINDFVISNFGNVVDNIADFIKITFVKTIYYHDFGKINPNFQKIKMNNSLFEEKDYGIGSDHSILSAYLFLSNGFEEIKTSNYKNEYKNILYFIVLAFSHSIVKHHGSLNKALDYNINDILAAKILDFYQCFVNTSFLETKYLKFILTHKDDFTEIIANIKNNFSLFLFVKLNSSLLTASDYLATNQFMIDIEVNDFGLVSNALTEKIIKHTYEIPYNSDLNNRFDHYLNFPFGDLQTISKYNLNILRQKLSAEVISNLRNNTDNKLFYIEAPTGSGKTNLSLLVLNEILKKKPEVNKIFYVFPFTSLISQTFDFIKDNLHLTENELIQLHSKAPYTKSNIGNDDEYGSKRKNYIDSLFVNYPIVLLTHIKFFDILTSNEKEPNYLLHRLTNSIIILDEMQSYTPSEWDKINYFLQNYSNSLNITFILMSATLPKISKLLIDKNAVANDPFVYLITNKNKYFNNPNFQNRVKFRFDYVDKMKFNNENLADIVSKHSEEYFNKNGRVQSIIEFITKNSAQSFFEFINDNSILTDYKKFIITGTILYPRRNEIIKYLKSNVKEDSKILIIATQVIEAGLDIDMDIGFKDMSIMDSEEQFAGRINRNASKNNSEIFLFKSNLAQHVYNSDLRFREQKNIGKEILYEILQNKDFDSYYSFIFNNIEKFNQDIFAENLSSFLVLIKQLNYTEIKRKFELIKSDTISIFVPLKISKESFTENELDFINTFNQSNSNSYNEVSGRDIWTIYKNLITNKKLHFVDKKADLRILSSILTKFTFSVWKNTNFYQLLKNYGNEEYGYFFLDYWEDIYSYENGLKTDLETDCNFL